MAEEVVVQYQVHHLLMQQKQEVQVEEQEL